MEEWGLQAVVRGVTNDQFMTTTTSSNRPDSCFDSFLDDFDKEFNQEVLFSFPDIFETSTSSLGSNELEELYKPFCPTFSDTSFSPAMAPFSFSDAQIEVTKEEEEEDQIMNMKPFPFVSNSPTPALPRGAKHKTRKNLQKKVVLHVTADGLSSDLWAWRKYGQKPIKGSPYPRSYYRCSSSKGCLARRQVEQSCTNAGMYIITYTAEHNHAKPTRRNSLAGINRQKFGTVKSQTRDINAIDSPIASPAISPLSSSVDEDVLSQPIKEGRRDSEHGENDEKEFVIPDIMLSDDFFSYLGNSDEVALDLSVRNRSTKQLSVSFCS